MSSSVARVSSDLQSAMSELVIDDKDPSFTASRPRILTLNFPDRPDQGPTFYLNQAWEKLKPAIRIVYLDEPEDFNCTEIFNVFRRVDGRTLWELCIHELFPPRLCMATKIADKVLSNILVLINHQRSGKPVNLVQLGNLMDMFNGVSYDKSRYFFEKPFLQGTAAEALQVLEQSDDLSQHLKHVEKRLSEKKAKCNRLYFFIETKEPLIEVVEREFLEVHAASILEKGFAKLMSEKCGNDLHRLYDLYSEANLVACLSDALSSYILKTGREILAKGLSSLETFQFSVERICHSYFLQDESLENTMDQCFMDLGLPKKDRLNADIL